jgi:signal transduction histidine kinase
MNVSLWREGETIRIAVEDDGRGFSVLSVRSRERDTGGFGLFSIRERLDHLGGDMDIDAAPGRGTRAVLTAALEPDAATVTEGVA